MKSKAASLRRRRNRGAVFFLVMALMIIVLPTLLLFVKYGNYQNTRAFRDRNIKTAREMAESVNVDFMNTFSDDWQRDYFDPTYTDHEISGFAGLGSATASLDIFRERAVISLRTVATYNKGISSFPMSAQKSIRSTYFWSSDALKFDYVFPGDVTLGVNVDKFITRIVPATMENNTFYVNGNFDSGSNTGDIRGFWVVKSTFVRRNPVNLINATVHCNAAGLIGPPPLMVNSTIRTFPDTTLMVPHVKIIGPEGANASGSLAYYGSKKTAGVMITAGNALRLTLGPATYTTTELDTSLDDIPSTTQVLAYTGASPDPWIFAATGGDVYLDEGVINRPTTVVVLGGDAHVIDNVTYDGALTASADRSFALMTDQDLYIENPGLGLVQTLVGFYSAHAGSIKVQGNNRNIFVTGTLYGPIGLYTCWQLNVLGLRVSADPGLSQFPPPLFPRRPRLIQWRYHG
jgi:hypothetical protein